MSSDKRLFIQIYEVIVTDILNNRYKYNDFLPTLSELCKKFNAGRNTIRSVMSLLEDRGFIKTQRGRKAKVIFNINEENSKKLYETTIYERKAAYVDIYRLLISFMPEVIVELKNRAKKEKLEQLIDKINNIYDGNHISKNEEEFTDKLYTITIEAIAILDNTLLDSLYLSMIRFIYLPVPTNVNQKIAFNHVLNLVNERLPKIASFLLSTNTAILKKSITILMQTLSHSSMQYVYRISSNVETEHLQSIPFRWASVRNLDLLYMDIVIQMIQDINNYVYQDDLPSLQEMADHYQVSLKTIRKATDILNEYKIIQKTNGLKSKIIIKQIDEHNHLFANQEVITHILCFKEAVQILFILIKSIQKNILSSINNNDINKIIDVSDPFSKQVLENLILFLIAHSSTTVQSIYEELNKTLAWQIYSGKMFNFSVYHQYYHSRNPDLIKAIQKKNYNAINTYLDDLYTCIENDINNMIMK